MSKREQTSYESSYLFFAIISSFIVILSVGAIAFFSLYNQRFNQEEDMGKLFTQQNSNALQMWINDQVNIAQIIALTPHIQNVCESPKNNLLRDIARKRLEDIQNEHPEYTLITIIPFFDPNENILVLNNKGSFELVKNAESIVDSSQGVSIGVGGLDFNYIRAIYEGEKVYISEAKPNAIEGLEPIFMVAVPIYVDSKLKGALAFGVKLGYFSSLFKNSVKLSKNGQIGIIDDRGLYVSHINPDMILNRENIQETQAILENLKAGKTSFNVTDNDITWKYTASEVVIEQSSANRWWFLYKRDSNEVFAELATPLGSLAFLCFVIFCVVMIVSTKANKSLQNLVKEKNLRKEMELHHIYTQHIGLGIALIDNSNIFADINPTMEELLNCDRESIIGKNLSFIFEDNYESLTKVLEVIEKKEKQRLLNVTIKLGDKSKELVDIAINYIDMSDIRTCTILTFTQVPSSRDFEERMQALYTASPDVYLTFDTQFNLLECTETALKLFKVNSKAEIINNFDKFSPPKQPNGNKSDRYALDLINAAINQDVQRFEWVHIDSFGEKIPCEVTLMGFFLKGKPAAIGVLRDMRKQREYEVALIKERALLRSIIDNIQGIIFLRDKDLNYVLVNKKFTNVFGLEQEFVVGRAEADFFPEEITDFCIETDTEAIIAKGIFTFEQTLTLMDNTRRDYLFTKEALYTPTGSFDGILTVGIDITRIKEAERQISIAKLRAEEADQAKSDFLARMSHEIRTPMNAIIGISYLCLQTDLNEQQEAYLGKINEAADHLMSIINSILDFSKIESGKVVTELVPFDLNQILSKLETLLEEKVQSSQLKLNIICDSKVPKRLIGDPVHVLQILLNLGANAVKFTTQGSVTIEIQLETSLEDRVYLYCKVIDTGIGMSPEQMSKLFEPFSQGAQSITRLYGGTGLGLVISKSLIELMDGKIWVESTQNEGSTFHFNIWLQVDNPEAIEIKENQDSILQQVINKEIVFDSKTQILVVEDNMINQEIIMELLKKVNVNVDIANNGEEALKFLEHKNYDLIFMDIQMPVMDGITACKKIRTTNKTVPVIAMTANAQLNDRKKSLEAGMNDHITKPIELEKLYSCLKRYIKYQCISKTE